ncbi:MAG TPA: D-arabinono-1,4-lactone oxidase [Thermodesulfobacteriota bacterium]|nr:D-arabinono-1,4-lactone oxidase [Thermodesulfobacteriota bacterium]
MTERWTNWRENQECKPAKKLKPASVDEVIKIVKEAKANGRKIRVVGTGHSWTDLVCTDGYLISLDKLNRITSVDKENHQVTVGAGIKIQDLNDELYRHGLALTNMGTISRQSIAGATSTGTHGTGIKYSNMSTFIVALELITADGEILRITEGDEIFDAARLSLGAFGIVTQVTLQCEPAYGVHTKEELIPFTTVPEKLEEYVNTTDYLHVMDFPHTDYSYLMFMNRIRTPFEKSELGKLIHKKKSQLLRGSLLALITASNIIPSSTKKLTKAVIKPEFVYREATGKGYKMLNFEMEILFKYYETEYAIKKEHIVDVLKRLRRMIEENDLSINMPITLRFVKGDDLWLSPTYKQDSCYFSLTMGGSGRLAERHEEYFRLGEKIFIEYKGRPHWGKLFYVDLDYIKSLYPRYDDFRRLRDQLDPRRMFCNEYLDRLFPEGG